MNTNPLEIKVCIIGDTDVGKSSLAKRYCEGEFPENSTPTIGASFLQKRVVVSGETISLQIWDTAGQERFRSMAPMYYRHAKAAICVFDVTNEESFHRVASWLRDLKQHADPSVVIALAGNKCDKPAKYDLKMCDELAASVGASFHKTSAVTGEGVNQVFENLCKNIADAYRAKNPNSNGSSQSQREADVLKLAGSSNNKQSGGCC